MPRRAFLISSPLSADAFEDQMLFPASRDAALGNLLRIRTGPLGAGSVGVGVGLGTTTGLGIVSGISMGSEPG